MLCRAGTVQRAVGKEQGRVWSPSELQARWNATAGERHVLCLRDSSGSYRPQLSDHSRHREVLRLWLGEGEHASDHSLELLMEADPPIAIATHRRESLAWSPQVRAAHLDTWAATVDPQPALSSLWSLVLSDSMLIRLPDNPAPAQLLTAVHSARWAADERRWMPLADTSTADQACAVTAAAARARSRDRALRAIRCAIAAGDSSQPLRCVCCRGWRTACRTVSKLRHWLRSSVGRRRTLLSERWIRCGCGPRLTT